MRMRTDPMIWRNPTSSACPSPTIYMREVVQADRLTTCGGDGGCNICGGLGPFLGFLPCSPHCKPEVQEDKELNGDYDFYRPIIRVENHD